MSSLSHSADGSSNSFRSSRWFDMLIPPLRTEDYKTVTASCAIRLRSATIGATDGDRLRNILPRSTEPLCRPRSPPQIDSSHHTNYKVIALRSGLEKDMHRVYLRKSF